MRAESPSSPRERRSVYTVRRSIISMRYLNFIKKDEKHIPHFRRTALFPSGGGKPEGKEGEQLSPRDVYSISRLSTTKPAGRGSQYFHVKGRTPVPTPEHDVYSIIITPRRPDALIWMQNAKAPPFRRGAY